MSLDNGAAVNVNSEEAVTNEEAVNDDAGTGTVVASVDGADPTAAAGVTEDDRGSVGPAVDDGVGVGAGDDVRDGVGDGVGVSVGVGVGGGVGAGVGDGVSDGVGDGGGLGARVGIGVGAGDGAGVALAPHNSNSVNATSLLLRKTTRNAEIGNVGIATVSGSGVGDGDSPIVLVLAISVAPLVPLSKRTPPPTTSPSEIQAVPLRTKYGRPTSPSSGVDESNSLTQYVCHQPPRASQQTQLPSPFSAGAFPARRQRMHGMSS